ncbi:sigma-70 family RNA polymerase sigma factor [Rhodobacteraceae bacterium NNCM2]|nr:sigma-70 family RNA polymerase sigma factor [Coraliihabitans acroporae]
MTKTVTSSGTGRSGWEGVADEDLLARIGASQDRPAFAEIFRRYAGRIKAFLIKSGARPEEAEEAVQEVMVTVWRRAATFDPAKAGASTWIYTIARNKRIDMIRRGRKAEGYEDDPQFQAEPVESSESSVVAADRDARIRRAILALSDDQKAVIKMAFFAGLSHTEIAGSLDVPLGTVKSRLRLAFSKMRAELGCDFALELVDN